jgi:periplasmic protein TonB
VKRYRAAQSLRSPLAPFFALSIAVHLLIGFLWPKYPIRQKGYESITVSLLATPEPTRAEPQRPAGEPAPRASKAPALFAKKMLPRLEERQSREPTGRKAQSQEETLQPTPPLSAVIEKKASPDLGEKPVEPAETMIRREPMAPNSSLAEREPVAEKSIVAKSALPPIQDILPRERRIPLGTKEPRYASYLENVRRAIDFNWEYPELALLYGLQGKLIVEFTILANGRIEFLTLVRSSGSTLLDEEALRAIRAAAPFPRIPTTMSANRLLISASMEYHDGRLKYQFGR